MKILSFTFTHPHAVTDVYDSFFRWTQKIFRKIIHWVHIMQVYIPSKVEALKTKQSEQGNAYDSVG